MTVFRVACTLVLVAAYTATAAKQAFAQAGATGRITGTVTGRADQRPILGASVTVVGTSLGAQTNEQGQFNIAGVPAGSATIRARMIGFAPVDRAVSIPANGVVELAFALETQAVGLREVLVTVDVGTVRRVEVGSDVGLVNAEAVVKGAPIGNISDLLASRMAGVEVKRGTGPVGTAAPIRVRGVASIGNASNPLIIVDGIRVSNSSASGPASIDWAEGRTISRIDDIDPNDIANVQVIKGPTATALYGSEAASGVIIIETKRGRTGAPQLDISTEYGTYEDNSKYAAYDKYFNMTRYLGITSLDDPVARQWSAVENPVTGAIWAKHNPLTNPLTDPRRTGSSSSTSLSVRGGTQAARYFLSGRFEDTQGVFTNNFMKRANFRANIDATLTPTVNVSVSTSYMASNIRVPESSRSFRGLTTNGGAGSPINSYGVLPNGGRGDCLAVLEVATRDPVATCDRFQGNLQGNFTNLLQVYGGQQTGRFVTSAALTWTPNSWLSNRLTVGLDNTQNKDLNEFPVNDARPFGLLSAGFIRDSRQTTRQQTVEWASTATRPLSEVLVSTTTLGAQYFKVSDEFSGCTGEGGFASPTATACNSAILSTGFSGGFENIQLGYYLQQRLAWRDVLYATAAIRADENSAFGQQVGVIFSPSVSLSWVVSDMGFWPESFSQVNSLRLRTAYGQAAQAPPPYAADQRLAPTRLTTATTTLAAFSPLFPGNPDLGPERKAELEFGADIEFFEGRYSARYTHYRQTVTDAILNRVLAPSLGFLGSQFVNIGELTNNGHELALSAALVESTRLRWDVDLTLSTQDPIVTDLGGVNPLFLGNDRGMIMEGFAPGAYYGPIVESAQRAADGTIVPGSIVYKDCPELPQNFCHYGSPQPTNLQTFATTLGILDNTLRVNMTFDRRGNVFKRNGSMAFNTGFHRDRGSPLEYAFRESRVSPREQASMEQRLAGVANADSEMWAEDGSFVRFRELSVGYQLPPAIANLFRGRNVSVTAGGRNLAVWTKFRGIDPESFVRGGLANIGGNEEFFGEAIPRYFFMRLNIGAGQ